MLNVGPDKMGNIPALAKDRMNDISKWMSVNKEAIYSTKPITNKIYNTYLTQNNTHIFLFIKKNTDKHILMYVDPKTINKITMLTQNGELPVFYKPSMGKGIVITIPTNLPFSSLSVLKIEKTSNTEKKLSITD